ncbi:AraC family transcriptional regulator ligand-binding domain-containing protein [Bacteriovoracaceae bacterium]|nr:AraC family transcriptional regulator ligand-binding domain-containing protein [Bacteriovoracaceae bacterium]
MSRKTTTTMGLKAVLVGLASLGHNHVEILKKSHINPEKIDDPDGRLSLSKIDTFWKTVAHTTKQARPGLMMSQHIPFGTYHTIDYLFASSPTIEQGLKRLARFYKLMHQDLTLEIREVGNDLIKIEINEKQTTLGHHHHLDYEIGLVLSRIYLCLGKNPSIEEVGFQYDIGNYENVLQHYLAIFGTDKVTFSRPSNYILLHEKVIKSASQKNKHHLVDILEKNTQDILNNISQLNVENKSEDFLTKATNILREEIKNGDTSIQKVADHFKMSSRTFQRKLRAINFSYSDLLNETRKKMSKELLQDNNVSLTEISFLLGFSESSSFHKAFKKWTGMTPKDYRSSLA